LSDKNSFGETYRLGHANAGIADGQRLVLLVGDDIDTQVLARVELGRVREGLIADFVESIRGVGNEFSEKDFLVGVDGVDDEGQELRDFSLELERLRCRHDGELSEVDGNGVKKGCVSAGDASMCEEGLREKEAFKMRFGR
jgi:hypothetical protein